MRATKRRECGYTHKYAPEVDEHEHAEVQLLMHGEEINEDVIRQRLQVAVKRVERVRRKGRRDW